MSLVAGGLTLPRRGSLVAGGLTVAQPTTGQTVNLVSAPLYLDISALSSAGGPAVTQMATAVTTLSSSQLQVHPGELLSALNAATLVLTPSSTGLAVGAATLDLVSSNLIFSGSPLTTYSADFFFLNSAVLALSPSTVTFAPGTATLGLTSSILPLSARPLMSVPGGVSVNLATGVLTFHAQQLSAAPGQLTLSMTSGVLTLHPSPESLLGGPATLDLTSGVLTLNGSVFTGAQALELASAVIGLLGQYLFPPPPPIPTWVPNQDNPPLTHGVSITSGGGLRAGRGLSRTRALVRNDPLNWEAVLARTQEAVGPALDRGEGLLSDGSPLTLSEPDLN